MQFCVLTNGIVTEVCCGQIQPYEGRSDILILPDDHNVTVGTRKVEINERGYLIPVSERISRGIIVLDDYHVLDGEDIRRKTDEELVVDGLLPTPVGFKVEDGAILAMTIEEKIEAGLVVLGDNDVLINGEILSVPIGRKVLNGEIVDMTVKEQIEAGIRTAYPGTIYDESTDTIREMTIVEKVKSGFMPAPRGQILDGDALRPMTSDERYLSGVDPLQYNMRIIDGAVVVLTEKELNRESYDKDDMLWRKQAKIKCSSKRDVMLRNGFSFNNNMLQADTVSVGNANATLNLVVANMAELPISWITADNSVVEYSRDEFMLMVSAMGSFVSKEHLLCRSAKDAIDAATDFESAYAVYDRYMSVV